VMGHATWKAMAREREREREREGERSISKTKGIRVTSECY
jgi:hypothetical protein